MSFVFDTSEMWKNETIVLSFTTAQNCYYQTAYFKVQIELTGEILVDLGSIKEVEFDQEFKEEYFVILGQNNLIDLGPWFITSQKAKLGENYKKFVRSSLKIKTANEVESYAGVKTLKQAFEETLSLEKTKSAMKIYANLKDLDPNFEHSSV